MDPTLGGDYMECMPGAMCPMDDDYMTAMWETIMEQQENIQYLSDNALELAAPIAGRSQSTNPPNYEFDFEDGTTVHAHASFEDFDTVLIRRHELHDITPCIMIACERGTTLFCDGVDENDCDICECKESEDECMPGAMCAMEDEDMLYKWDLVTGQDENHQYFSDNGLELG